MAFIFINLYVLLKWTSLVLIWMKLNFSFRNCQSWGLLWSWRKTGNGFNLKSWSLNFACLEIGWRVERRIWIPISILKNPSKTRSRLRSSENHLMTTYQQKRCHKNHILSKPDPFGIYLQTGYNEAQRKREVVLEKCIFEIFGHKIQSFKVHNSLLKYFFGW